MKDENDILTKDMVKLLRRHKDCNNNELAIMIMYQVRSNLGRYFKIFNKEE